MQRVSPWANDSVAPLQAAGALVPLVQTERGVIFDRQFHGTAFFISDAGLFLTAGHVVDQFPNEWPPLTLLILNVHGLTAMRVAWVTRHPTVDVALGLAVIEEGQRAMPSPLALSTQRLTAGRHVAILGYPQTVTQHTIGDDGDALSRLRFTPDFYEGNILEHHPTGVSLAKWPTYSTDISPPPPLKDFSGISGGPLVATDSLHVHGVASSTSETYALCTDVETVLDWDVFEHDVAGCLTVRQFEKRYPGVVRVV